MTFPRIVKEVWEDSDGKLHTSKGAALVAERMIAERNERNAIVDAINDALRDAQYHNFGTFSYNQAIEPKFIREISQRLYNAGFRLK